MPFNVCDKAGLHQLIYLDWSCAYKANAVILQKEKVWAKAAKRPFEPLRYGTRCT